MGVRSHFTHLFHPSPTSIETFENIIWMKILVSSLSRLCHGTGLPQSPIWCNVRDLSRSGEIRGHRRRVLKGELRKVPCAEALRPYSTRGLDTGPSASTAPSIPRNFRHDAYNHRIGSGTSLQMLWSTNVTFRARKARTILEQIMEKTVSCCL